MNRNHPVHPEFLEGIHHGAAVFLFKSKVT